MKRNAPLILILVIAASLRIGVLVGAHRAAEDDSHFMQRDSYGYTALAETLWAERSFTRGGEPELRRTLAYPLLLSTAVWSEHKMLIIHGMHVVLSVVTVLLTYLLARRVYGEMSALFAGALYACEPLSILYVNLVMTETLFTCAFTAFLYTYVRSLDAKSYGWSAVAGLLAGVVAHVRPIGYPLALGVGFLHVFLAWITGKRVPQAAAQGGLMLIAAACLIVPWQVRNLATADYSGFSTISDTSLYFYQGAATLAEHEGRSYVDLQKKMVDEYFSDHPEQKDWSLGEISKFRRQAGLKMIADHPLDFLIVHTKGVILTLIGPGASGYLRLLGVDEDAGKRMEHAVHERGAGGLLSRAETTLRRAGFLNIALASALMIAYLLAVMGVAGGRSADREAVVFLLLIAGYLVFTSSVNGYSRFRHPVMPIVCVFAGNGIHVCSAWIRGRLNGS